MRDRIQMQQSKVTDAWGKPVEACLTWLFLLLFACLSCPSSSSWASRRLASIIFTGVRLSVNEVDLPKTSYHRAITSTRIDGPCYHAEDVFLFCIWTVRITPLFVVQLSLQMPNNNIQIKIMGLKYNSKLMIRNFLERLEIQLFFHFEGRCAPFIIEVSKSLPVFNANFLKNQNRLQLDCDVISNLKRVVWRHLVFLETNLWKKSPRRGVFKFVYDCNICFFF